MIGLPTSERLEFRFWQPTDFDLALSLWGDPEVTRFIDARGKLSPSDVRDKLAQELASQTSHNVSYFPVFLRATGDPVGCAGLRPRDLEGKIYELGFHVLWRHWGQGFATEAATAAIEFAFDELHARQLFAGHHPENRASRAVLDKLGFRRIGEELYPPTGLLHPSYELTRP